jgi:hypothetical protein
MEDAKWAKYAAIGGPWFVVLSLVGGFLAGSPVMPDDSADKVTKFFVDNDSAIKFGVFLGALGVIGIIWWFGSLWRRMVAAENGRPRISIVALAGLIFGGVFASMNGVLISTVAIRIKEDGASAAPFFNTMSFVCIGMAGVGITVFLAAVTSLSYRTKMFAAWMNYLGWLAALCGLISTYMVATDSGGVAIFGLISFFAFCVWILAVSWVLWSEPATAGATAVTMATA